MEASHKCAQNGSKLAWVFSKDEKEKVEAAIKAQLPKELLLGGAKGLLGGKKQLKYLKKLNIGFSLKSEQCLG